MTWNQRLSHLVVVLIVAALPAGAAGAEPPIARVSLSDGRVISGNIDTRSDRHALWVRRSEAGIVLRSRIELDRIDHITWNGRDYQLRDFERLLELASTRGLTFAELPAAVQPVEFAAQTPAAPRMVSSLQIVALPCQWDSDAHLDGMELQVTPLDALGQFAPTAGQLEVDLHGQETHRGGAGRLPKQPEVVELERWNLTVRLSDFDHGAAVYRLPFDRFHPEVDVNVSSTGLLYARLSVSGGNVFEASLADVCVRPASEFRDNLQLYHGPRWLPLEREPMR